MVASSISAEHSKEILAPMRELHELRNEIGGHAFNEMKAMPSEMAFTRHGSFQTHFFTLPRDVDRPLSPS